MDDRERLCPQGPYRLLAIVQPNMDLDPGVMLEDHYGGRGLNNWTRALAIAAQGDVAENMLKVHFAHFPQALNVAIFQEEQAARRWLDQTVPAR